MPPFFSLEKYPLSLTDLLEQQGFGNGYDGSPFLNGVFEGSALLKNVPDLLEKNGPQRSLNRLSHLRVHKSGPIRFFPVSLAILEAYRAAAWHGGGNGQILFQIATVLSNRKAQAVVQENNRGKALAAL